MCTVQWPMSMKTGRKNLLAVAPQCTTFHRNSPMTDLQFNALIEVICKSYGRRQLMEHFASSRIFILQVNCCDSKKCSNTMMLAWHWG